MEVKDKKIYDYIINGNLAIDDVVEDYSNYVYSVIKNNYSNLSSEDIEEIRLDVFFIVWKNKDKLDINQKFSSYIAGITRNLIKQKWRYIKINEDINNYEDKLISNLNIENTLKYNEQSTIIINKLKTMSEEDRNIFIQYYFENNTIKEISKMNNLSESKVGTKLHRIRKKLQHELKKGGYEHYE